MNSMKLKGLLVLGSLALLAAACNFGGEEGSASQEAVGSVESAAIAKISCDVTTPQGLNDCTNNNAAWAAACCPAGQVGTGNCAVTQQRCVQPQPIPAGGACGTTNGTGGCNATPGTGGCVLGTSCQPPASGGGTTCTCR